MKTNQAIQLAAAALTLFAFSHARADMGSMDMSNSEIGAGIASEAAGYAMEMAVDAAFNPDRAGYALQQAQEAAAQARSGLSMTAGLDNLQAGVNLNFAAQAVTDIQSSLAGNNNSNGVGCGGSCDSAPSPSDSGREGGGGN